MKYNKDGDAIAEIKDTEQVVNIWWVRNDRCWCIVGYLVPLVQSIMGYLVPRVQSIMGYLGPWVQSIMGYLGWDGAIVILTITRLTVKYQ